MSHFEYQLNGSNAVLSAEGVAPITVNGVSGVPETGNILIGINGTGFVNSITATAPLTANGLSGVPQGGSVTLAANNATTTTVGVASFNSTNFSVSGAGSVTSNNFTISTGTGLTGGGSLTLGGSLSLSVTSAVPLSFTTNSGTAVPSSNVLSITGGATGLTTAGSGNTVSLGGTLLATNGGSGLGTSTPYAPYCGGTLSGGTFQQATTGFSTSGNVFVSNGSSTLPSWQAISSIGVSSVQGTANQITPTSPTIGAVTLALANGISIGSYQASTPPTGGILLPGPIVLGQTSTSTGASIAVNNTQAYGYLLLGTTSQGKISYGFFNEQTIVETGAFPIGGFVDETTYTVSTGITSPLAASFYSSVGFTGNLGTITNFYGFYFDGAGAAAGTLTNVYGGYFTLPAVGTNKTSLHADNASIGTYNGSTVPPSNGLIVSGNSAIGSSSANPTSVKNVRLYVAGGNLNIDNGFQLSLRSDIGTEASGGYWMGFNGSQGTGGSYTVATLINVNDDSSTKRPIFFTTSSNNSITGTLAAGVGIWPIVFGMGVGPTYSIAIPPTNGMIVEGKVGIGTNSPSYALDVVPTSNTDRYVAHTGNGILVGPGTNASVGSILVDTTLEPNFAGTLSGASAQIFVTPNFAPQSGTTINQAAGMWISSGSTAGSGTTTLGYGLVVLNPAYGSTSKMAAYLDNLSIGYSSTSPPTNGAIITGQVGVGTSAPAASAILDLTSSSKGFVPPRLNTPTSAITSPTNGLMAYNTANNCMQVYNSSAGIWFNQPGWVLISSATAAGVASLTFTNSSTLPFQNFQSVFVNMEYILPVTASTTLEVQFLQSGTPVTSGYTGGQTTNQISTTNTWGNTNSTTFIGLGPYPNTIESSAWLLIQNTQGGSAVCWSGTTSTNGFLGILGGYNVNVSINGLTFFFSSGNINLLEVQIYGLYNS